MAELRVPEGWRYTPTVYEKPPCPTCGHVERIKEGSLTSPSGRTWPLVGNRSKTAERQMVTAIIEAHT